MTGPAWARELPDEVLLVQFWLSVQAALKITATEASWAQVTALSEEIQRRGLQAAVIPAGRAMRPYPVEVKVR